MTNKTQKVLVPKFRFPEFRDEWEEKEISDIAELKKGNGLSKSKLTKEGRYKCILYGELFTTYTEKIDKVKSRTNFKEGVFSIIGDILIPSATTTSAIDLAKATVIYEDNVLLGGDINIIRPSNKKVFDSLFLAYMLTHTKKHSIAKLAQGITIIHLYSNSLNKLCLAIPSNILEQQKIAHCLSSIDTVIELEGQKLNALRDHKKGLLQNLFPAEGKTLPKFRFPEFRDEPEWEEVLLGQNCEITTGRFDANAMVENGRYRFYTCAKDYYFINNYAFDTDALLISGNGANVGYIHHYKGKFNAYQRTYVLDQFSQNIFFIKYFLEKNLHERIFIEKKAGNTPYIVKSTLTDMVVLT
ncbi:MAG: restriction endonuclease subunit S, partial [Salinispira sp.]